MKANIYNLENEVVGKMELPDKIFAERWRPALVAQVLRAQLANRRKPWAHAKTRAEVRGGGRKPWRQKGTGRARHGSTRSPLWVGGGKAHGPTKERDYSEKVNKKMKRTALFSVLSKKLGDAELKFFDSLEPDAPKTKALAGALRKTMNLGKAKKYDVLLVAGSGSRNIVRASANLPKTKTVRAGSLNVYDALNYKSIFVEKEAAGEIAKHYKSK